jgi:WD40 repeat protein
MRIGAYEVTAELGRGGMGVVHAARAPDGREVAVKVLLGTKPASLARFERERRLLASLGEAEGFVPLLDAGETPQGPYIVMPLLRGGTLRARLEKGPLGVDETVSLGIALAEALGRAHALGIVHRDVKPENVLFSDSGRPFLSDLGVAKHFRSDSAGASQSVALSRSSELHGTPGYLPPEQMNDSRTVTAAADVFALGAILYECLAGHPAFVSDTPLGLLVKTTQKLEEPLLAARPETPRWLERVIDGALERDPVERYQDGHALARALRARGGEAGPGRGIAVAAGLLAGLALLIGAALAFGSRRGKEAPLPDPAPAPRVEGPGPSPPPRPSFPHVCDGFLAGRNGMLHLASLYGRYEGKQKGEVHAVSVAPDGRLGLGAGADGSVVLWNMKTRDEEGRFVEDGRVLDACFSPSGDEVLVATDKGAVRLRATNDGREKRLFLAPSGKPCFTVALSADGKRAASGGADGILHVWDVETGREEKTLRARGQVLSVAFLPGGDRVLEGRSDGLLTLWDLPSEKATDVVGHGDAVRGVAVSPDGSFAVSIAGPRDPTIRVVELATGMLVATFPGSATSLHGIALSPDGKRVLAGGPDRAIHLIDVTKGAEARVLKGPTSNVTCVAFAPDGRHALSGETDGLVRFWDLDSGEEQGGGPGRGGNGVRGVALLRDGKRLVTGSGDSWLRVFDRENGRELDAWDTSRGFTPGMNSVKRAPGDDRLLLAHFIHSVSLWDPDRKERLEELEAPRWHNVLAAVFTPDGTRAVTGADDSVARVWDLSTGRSVAELDAKDGYVTSFAFTPDGKRLYTGGTKKILVWDTSTWTRTGTILDGPDGFGGALAIDSTGKHLVTGGGRGGVGLWDLAGPTQVGGVTAHSSGVRGVAFLPDDRRIVSIGEDGTIALFDLPGGKELDRIDLASSHDAPKSLAIDPDGRRLYVGTDRGVVLGFTLDAERR